MSTKFHAWRVSTISSLLIFSILCVCLLTACNSTPPTGACGANATKLHLINSDRLTVASTTNQFPQSFLDPDNPSHPTGFDLDLIQAIGKQLCPGTAIVQVDFEAIIPGLTTPAPGKQHYDLAISGIPITPERQQQVDMLPYFRAGESLLVPAGNPEKISDLKSLCGKKVAVQQGTTAQAELTAQNQSACGARAIQLLTFAAEDDALAQLLAGNVDATYQSSPLSDYYVFKNPGKLEAGPALTTPTPEGIVLRKDNPTLEAKVKQVLCALVSNGTYLSILQQWGQGNGALAPDQFACS
ncbi:MAG TPA: ABC transporter substrate-binding protein [Ktedonobacterales bacterium]